MTLQASDGIGSGEAGRAAVESLPLDFQRLAELSHPFGNPIAGLFV